MLKGKKNYFISYGALIAALYVVLSLVSSLFGLANGVIQVRISEALCVLPYFGFSAVPGLALGCCITNIVLGANVFDIVFGTVATLLGALGTYLLRKKTYLLAPVPPVIANTLIIPIVLKYAYGMGSGFAFMFFTIFAGEAISCGFFGLLLLKNLKKHDNAFIRRK